MNASRIGLFLAATAGMTLTANAAPVLLDFEGLKNQEAVEQFYNGGTGSLGSSGPNFGASFSSATLAIIDSDAGGGGNIANEPSPSTVMFFLAANNAVLNFAAGFDTGFSFFYTSSRAANVTVWSGLNASGVQLGTIGLNAQNTDNCVGDPNGTFCNWTAVGVAFAGTAMSIDFGGTANQTAYDNITFGRADPCGGNSCNVPEPATLPLVGLGLLALLGAARRVVAA